MKNQFEPFDKVLVRMDYRIHKCMFDKPLIWCAAIFSHIEKTDDGRTTYCANSTLWDECIPYNENTAHLLGTNEPYEEPEPKVWNVKDLDTGVHYGFTQNQFEHFMHDVLGSKKCSGYLIHRIN